ncbi:MAG: AAA family ATPase [Gemmatimonadota bacterium]
MRPFVGRESQLAQLDEALSRATDGKVAVVFITGEPGAGKTALAAEFARRAQETYPTLVYAPGRCDAHDGQGDPYLPFREVLDVLTGDVEGRLEEGAISDENARRLTSFIRSTVKSVFQYGPALIEVFVPGAELASRLGTELARKLGWRGKEAAIELAGFEQEHVQEQYANVLGALAEERPLVILLDDLHWADEASLSLLFHLGRRLVSKPVLIVGTYRAQDVTLGRDGERHPLEPIVNELKRDQGEIEVPLDPVSDAERRAFIDELLDVEDNDFDEEFRESFFHHTRGNPLFATELLRSLRERGVLRRAGGGRWRRVGDVDWSRIPARVEGVIAERVGRLDPDTRRLLATASVEGDEFSAQVVAAVEGVELRPLVGRLGEVARTHGLIRAQGQETVGGTRIWRYGFTHILIQKYLYESLDPAECGLLHSEVADSLIVLYGDEDVRIAGQLARHFELAGDRRMAARHRERAGHRARAWYANAEAAGHFQQALSHLRTLSDPGADSDSADPAVLARVLVALGEVESDRGEYEEALTAFSAALEGGGLTRLEIARVHRGIGDNWQRQHQEAETLASLDRALAVLAGGPADDDETRWAREWLDTKLTLLWAQYWWNRPDEMERIAEEIQPVMDAHGRPEQRAKLLRGLTALTFRRSRYLVDPDELGDMEEALTATRQTGHLPETCETIFQLGFAMLWASRLDEARDRLLEAGDMAARFGFGLLRLLSATYLAVVERLAQDVDEAARRAAEARAIAASAGNPGYEAVADANLAWVAWRRGDRERAERLVRSAVATWEAGRGIRYPLEVLGRWPLALLEYERGDTAAAIEQTRAILDPGQKRLSPSLEGALEDVLGRWEAGDEVGAAESFRAAAHAAEKAGYV